MELPGALKSAIDPGATVWDAMEGFYVENGPNKGDKDIDLSGLRRVCVSLLEGLMETGLSFSEEVRERAKKLALEWNGKVSLSKANTFEPLEFLLSVATYSLEAVADKGELVEYFFVAAGCRKAIMLCRSIGLGEKVYDLIQKLVDNGKQHLAVRFIFDFGLAEKFPPVPLLDNYLKETKKFAEQVCIDGKNSSGSLNVATEKEIGALKSVIKLIKDCRLEAEYPQECLQKRLEQFEKQLADRKCTAKLLLLGSSSVVPPFQPAGPTAVNPYLSSSATAVFGLAVISGLFSYYFAF
ncbi:wall-associated receptor kinase-like 22-like [Hibiscus syriacus]|uniref:FRIGIDA-like protein n=1 Tax=Hibiscus syriacus TaxID=106335 RepID=A0A6A2WWR6_HIBSY|nr:wall-associated receptor kinase-like 22-like [Hibiscus syriacus]